MKNKKLENIRKNIPLRSRIKVENEAAFITLISKLGYRESKTWTPEEDEILSKLLKLAEEHTEDLLKTIEEWKSDGCP